MKRLVLFGVLAASAYCWQLCQRAAEYRSYRANIRDLEGVLRVKDSLWLRCNTERMKVQQIIKGDSLGTVIRSPISNEIIYY